MPAWSKPPPSLRTRAIAWLAQREHTRQELAGKLARWLAARERDADKARAADAHAHAGGPACGAPALPAADEIEPLLDALEREGHLSNQRFIESRVHARARRYGNVRIEQELRRVGARADDATRAALKASEAERARAVWAARFGHRPADAAERVRQMRFLAGRGFSAETIRRVVAASEDDA